MDRSISSERLGPSWLSLRTSFPLVMALMMMSGVNAKSTQQRSVPALFKGQLWIDPITGVPVHQAGQFVDTSLHDGLPYIRTTHAVVHTRLPVGRAELTITERPLKVPGGEGASQLPEEKDKP